MVPQLGRDGMAGLDEALSDAKRKHRESKGSEVPQITHDGASPDSDRASETQCFDEVLSGDEVRDCISIHDALSDANC